VTRRAIARKPPASYLLLPIREFTFYDWRQNHKAFLPANPHRCEAPRTPATLGGCLVYDPTIASALGQAGTSSVEPPACG